MKIFQFIRFLKAIINTIFGRGAIILLLPILPAVASCQHSAFFNAGDPLLLDEIPGATAAYSVRQLSSTYTGNAVEVRRASDNATQNINFEGGQIDLGVLTSFCNGTNCFVKTWYDQSGNGNHATQDTAARQPKIWDSSSGLIKTGSKPAINFDGTNDFLNTDTFGIASSDLFFYTVLKQESYTVNFPTQLEFGNFYVHVPYVLGGNFSFYSSRPDIRNNPGISLNTNHLLSWTDNSSTNAKLYNNGILKSTYTGGSFPNTSNMFIFLGANKNKSNFVDGSYQEVVFYPISANRLGIETNVNNFFSIY